MEKKKLYTFISRHIGEMEGSFLPRESEKSLLGEVMFEPYWMNFCGQE